MANTFKIGDIVELKSGGPAMTVTNIGTAAGSNLQSVWCQWFTSTGKQEKGTFPVDAVQALSKTS